MAETFKTGHRPAGTVRPEDICNLVTMVHRQSRKLLQVMLALGGTAAVGIALLHIVLGPASIPGSVPVNATMDSEDRFYATLLLAYGLAVLECVRDVDRRAHRIKLLALVFLGGFVARVISAAVVGLPHPFFIVMAALELVLPLVIIWLATRVHPPFRGGWTQRPSNAVTSEAP